MGDHGRSCSSELSMRVSVGSPSSMHRNLVFPPGSGTKMIRLLIIFNHLIGVSSSVYM